MMLALMLPDMNDFPGAKTVGTRTEVGGDRTTLPTGGDDAA